MPYAETGFDSGEHLMLAIAGVVIALIGVALLPHVRMPSGSNAADLGWMSQRWLSEYRASQSA